MANAVAMAGLCGAMVESSLVSGMNLSSNSSSRASLKPAMLAARSQQQSEDSSSAVQGRRSMLSLLAASVAGAVLVKEASAATSIKVEGPPPPSGGLPGTENADQARDTDLPLKERFFIQPLSPTDAAQRAKFSAQDIIAVKSLIDKKAWPYVQNGLRSSAGYLRYDLNTVISSKTSKDEKKFLKALSAQLFDSLNALDYAARSKSTKDANKYYSQTIKLLDDVLNKIA